MSSLDDLVVVVTGAAGPAGAAATSTLRAAGATVVAVGHSPERLSALAERNPGVRVEVVDLSDEDAVTAVPAHQVDEPVHPVGGYRGGDTFTSNTEADWRF